MLIGLFVMMFGLCNVGMVVVNVKINVFVFGDFLWLGMLVVLIGFVVVIVL